MFELGICICICYSTFVIFLFPMLYLYSGVGHSADTVIPEFLEAWKYPTKGKNIFKCKGRVKQKIHVKVWSFANILKILGHGKYYPPIEPSPSTSMVLNWASMKNLKASGRSAYLVTNVSKVVYMYVSDRWKERKEYLEEKCCCSWKTRWISCWSRKYNLGKYKYRRKVEVVAGIQK